MCHIVPPTITFPPDGHTFYTNELTPAEFQCTATGIPAPEISWYRNETVLNSSTDARVAQSLKKTNALDCSVVEVVHTLTLYHSVDGDSGVFTCQSDNGLGAVSSQDFMLFVRGITVNRMEY